jgi:hypothetical protein
MVWGMKPYAYLLCALVAGIFATAGSDILARMWIADETLGFATGEHLRYAESGWMGTLFLLAPFLAVGWISAAFHKREQTRSAFLLFAVGLIPLIYFYFDGYQAAQQALADERWTAAALSIGLLPFFVGIPVVLLVGIAAVVALRFEGRMSD